MQKITPFLWFDDNAEEAVNFYTSTFKNSETGTFIRYNEDGAKAAHKPKGSVMTVSFNLAGTNFTAINGGPVFKFTPAVSFFVNCKTEDEVSGLWEQLSDGGQALMPLDKYSFSDKYGWIQDKFGLSWQLFLNRNEFEQKIVPSLLFVGNVAGKAEEAINLYTLIFNNSKTGTIFRYGADQKPDKEGTVAHAVFTLSGQKFIAMDSAHKHEFTFSEAQSFVVNCTTQKEVDHY